MKQFGADLHIHTALSPCAEDEMTPEAIVQKALKAGLSMIAICDHNTAGNTTAVREIAGKDLVVIAGIEITTVEEVHLIGLFPDTATAENAGEKILATLPKATDNDRKSFGEQYLMNAQGKVLGHEPKMLAVASTFNLAESVKLIHHHDGLAVAAHVDRRSFSIMSQLGIFPEDIRFDAVEISVAAVRASQVHEFRTFGLPVIASSDSHFLDEIGICRTIFEIVEPTFHELTLAVKNVDGRSCCVA
jgi:predicted metal-dependent phosphoesterase TrpH